MAHYVLEIGELVRRLRALQILNTVQTEVYCLEIIIIILLYFWVPKVLLSKQTDFEKKV